MKRVIGGICLLLLLAGCGRLTQSNTIFPAQLGKETQAIVNAVSPELLFFDYKVDHSIRSLRMELWTLEEEQWRSNGSVTGTVEQSKGRIGIYQHDQAFEMIQLDETGSTRSRIDVGEVFDENNLIGTSKLPAKAQLLPGQEVVLWVKAETEENGLSMVLEDFRSMDCDAGLALTITFYTQTEEELLQAQ